MGAVVTLCLSAVAMVDATQHSVDCVSTCKADVDCSLNGVCQASTGKCMCDPGWTGHCCGQLDLLPVDYSTTNGGYRHKLTSTWGGNVLTVDKGKTYHMWIAEMKPNGTGSDPGAGSCGLTTWSSNSQITHVISDAPTGPYRRADVAVPVWSHNPWAMPDGKLVMYHIGAGTPRHTPTYCAANATSACGQQGFDKCAHSPTPPPTPSPPPSPSVCDLLGVIPGWSCHAGSCSAGTDEARGNCGHDMAEPTVACNKTWAGCVPVMAAKCAGTTGV
jgi:hypothetical protein